MEHFAWKATVKEGMLEEYIRRHDEIWPEMTQVLNEAGVHNYTIWQVDNTLFGCYDAEFGVAFAAKVQRESPVVDRWNEYMRDVMEMAFDPETGTSVQLRQVFFHP